jgi:hypothetical protein
MGKKRLSEVQKFDILRALFLHDLLKHIQETKPSWDVKFNEWAYPQYEFRDNITNMKNVLLKKDISLLDDNYKRKKSHKIEVNPYRVYPLDETDKEGYLMRFISTKLLFVVNYLHSDLVWSDAEFALHSISLEPNNELCYSLLRPEITYDLKLHGKTDLTFDFQPIIYGSKSNDVLLDFICKLDFKLLKDNYTSDSEYSFKKDLLVETFDYIQEDLNIRIKHIIENYHKFRFS